MCSAIRLSGCPPSKTAFARHGGSFPSLRIGGNDLGRVSHGAGEYVGPNDIHTNSIESVWAVLRRSVHGTWHSVSAKHLDRYAAEASFRLNDGNVRVLTIDRMASFVRFAFRRRITYRKLTS